MRDCIKGLEEQKQIQEKNPWLGEENASQGDCPAQDVRLQPEAYNGRLVESLH